MSTDRPYATPEQYECRALRRIKDYANLHEQYLVALSQPCDCDRAPCANCRHTAHLLSALNDMVTRL